jgi:hypothetical protein
VRASLIKKLLVHVVEEKPKCLRCFSPLDVMHGDRLPHDGDFNVCAHCVCVMRIVEASKMTMRFARADEIMELRCTGELTQRDADQLLLFMSAGETSS